MADGKSPEWLPPGFTQKFKYKNGRKIKYYHNVVTGVNYHSKKDVINSATSANVADVTPEITNDDNDLASNNNVDDIIAKTNDSPDALPSGWIVEERTRKGGGKTYKIYTETSSGTRFYSRVGVTRYLNSVHPADTTPAPQNKLDNVDEPLSDTPPKLSITNGGPLSEKTKRDNSFKPVACVSTPADGLPSGWMKEMIISELGRKSRQDPYYTSPDSDYVFRSKPDALRFLKNGDIRYCASRPKSKEYLQLIKNDIPCSYQDNERASEDLHTKAQLFPDEEINGGGENSLTKVQADSNKNAENENTSEQANVKDVTSDSSTFQKLPESEIENGTHKTQVGSRKSRKGKEEPSLSTRASKRRAKCEVDALPDLPPSGPASIPLPGPVLNERAPNATVVNSAGGEVVTFPNLPLNGPATISPPSDIEPPKEEKPREEIQPSSEIQKQLPTEHQTIQEEQKQLNETQKMEGFYGFDGSWSDPCLDFAFKTLTGQIPIEDTLVFQNQTKQPQSDVVDPRPESSKAVDQLPANTSLFSAQGNLGFASFGGLNSQNPFTKAGNRDQQTKFNP